MSGSVASNDNGVQSDGGNHSGCHIPNNQDHDGPNDANGQISSQMGDKIRNSTPGQYFPKIDQKQEKPAQKESVEEEKPEKARLTKEGTQMANGMTEV